MYQPTKEKIDELRPNQIFIKPTGSKKKNENKKIKTFLNLKCRF